LSNLDLLPTGQDEERELAPGVMGWTVTAADGTVYVPTLRALRPGSGDVGRYLDSLTPNHRIPNVVSGRLARMLQRRGWRPVLEPHKGGDVDVWLHPDAKPNGDQLDAELCIARADECEALLWAVLLGDVQVRRSA